MAQPGPVGGRIVKALIIGFGSAGNTHLQAYKAAGVEVSAIADTAAGPLDIIRPEDGIQKVGPDWRRILPDVDIVSICSPDEYHFLQVTECLRAGKHVIVEKPPCTRPDELKFLMKWTAEHPEQNFACSLPLPWNFTELAAKIPDLGKIYLIEVEYNYGRKSKLMNGWRANPNYSMVLGGGLHMLDLVFWLHPERPADGAAFGCSTTVARVDTIQAIMRFPSGAIGRLGVNGGYEGRHYHRVAVFGEKADGLIVETTGEVDKTLPVKAFAEAVKVGTKIDNTRLWDAMKVCFEIESQVS